MQQQRIHFLDFSRSIAILMMLQGHFISMTYVGYEFHMDEVRQVGASSSYIFNVWGFFRGLTAPLFFTISGSVFSYLLHREWNKGEAAYWKLVRVKKGIKRALSLILIGYLLQINLSYLPYYLSGHLNSRLFGFHILQCIGLSLLCLLLLSSLLKKIRKWGWVLYLCIGFCIFVTTIWVRQQSGYLPGFAPSVLQNLIQGPETSFSIFPWMGYVFMGAAFGHWLSTRKQPNDLKANARFLLVIACLFYALGWLISFWIEPTASAAHFHYCWFFDRVLFVHLLIVFFSYLSQFERLRHPDFMRVGQETFFIYNVHAVLLYGAVTGISLRTFLASKLSGPVAFSGAILFLAFFIYLVKKREAIRQFFRNLRPNFRS
ncbi:MAG: hypothetical protein RLZZ301_1258 [Bacteroidota bacterium]|jgi:uncharacterized membrane protein